MKTWKFIVLGGLALSVTATNLLAKECPNVNTEEIERFFYNKGYNDAKNKFYEKGYRDGLKFAERKLAEYRAKIKALEQGKYLIENKKITYPEVYQVKDKLGNIRVVVGGCKIENPLSPEDIVKLPIVDKRICKNISNRDPYDVHYVEDSPLYVNTPTINNGVFLNERDELNLPKKPSDEANLYYYYFPNKEFYKKILEKNNIIYSVYEDKIKAVFDSKEAARKFCRLYKLKQGRDCL